MGHNFSAFKSKTSKLLRIAYKYKLLSGDRQCESQAPKINRLAFKGEFEDLDFYEMQMNWNKELATNIIHEQTDI